MVDATVDVAVDTVVGVADELETGALLGTETEEDEMAPGRHCE